MDRCSGPDNGMSLDVLLVPEVLRGLMMKMLAAVAFHKYIDMSMGSPGANDTSGWPEASIKSPHAVGVHQKAAYETPVLPIPYSRPNCTYELPCGAGWAAFGLPKTIFDGLSMFTVKRPAVMIWSTLLMSANKEEETTYSIFPLDFFRLQISLAH